MTLKQFIESERAKLNAATPGPWRLANECKLYNFINKLEDYADVHGPKYHHSAEIMKLNDAELIASAPTSLEKALSIIEVLEAALTEDALDYGTPHCDAAVEALAKAAAILKGKV